MDITDALVAAVWEESKVEVGGFREAGQNNPVS
jgi:hypothetical protein